MAFRWPFAGYVWARFVAYVGYWGFTLVSAAIVHDLTGSVGAVGMVTVAQFLPQILLTPWAGVLADRGHVRPQIVGGFVVCASGAAIQAGFLAAAGGVDGLPGPWPLVLASAVLGTGFAIGSAATVAVVPHLVDAIDLPDAVALNSLPLMGARAVGPAVGGLLLLEFGPTTASVGAVVANLACAAVMLMLGLPRRLTDEQEFSTTLRRAARFVLERRPLAVVLLAGAAVGVGAEPAMTLAPSLAAVVGPGASAGDVASAFGAGGLLGLTVLASVRRRLGPPRAALVGLVLMSAAAFAVAISPGAWTVLAGAALAGVGMTVAHAHLAHLLQELSPMVLRGRVTAL